MISNRCARKSLVTNCNSIISKNYLRFLVDSNAITYVFTFFAYKIILLKGDCRNLHNKFLPCFTYPVVSNRNRFSSNHSPYSASSICLLALSTADVSREAR